MLLKVSISVSLLPLAQDRPRFVESYQIAERDLRSVVAQHGRKPAGQAEDACRMM